jgi:hypothetical protein
MGKSFLELFDTKAFATLLLIIARTFGFISRATHP